MKINDISEGAVGHIAKNKKEANDPRYSMSITQDVKPGEVERQAAKFGNKIPPPVFSTKAAKNSTPNKLMNLGLAESVLLEKGMTPKELKKHEGTYLLALLTKIDRKLPLELTPASAQKYNTKAVIAKKSEAARLSSVFFPSGNYTKMNVKNGEIIEVDPKGLKDFKLRTVDGLEIKLSDLQKTADLKGKEEDFNIGDIGEYALGVAIATKFIFKGNLITLDNFYKVAQSLEVIPSKGGAAVESSGTFKINWGKLGKIDHLFLKTVIPGRSANYMADVLKGNKTIDPRIEATISSAIQYANQSEKTDAGVKYIRNHTESNRVEVIVDGISSAKGTKADLILTIDQQSINLISAKVGRSQLGQATGHDFKKQMDFFKTVFNVDVSKLAGKWGKTHKEHYDLLEHIWSHAIIPIIAKRLVGNNSVDEYIVVKQIATGLIRYANSSDSDSIDIVKLVSAPGSPGYKLMRIDQRLFESMRYVNLEARPRVAGVSIYGSIENSQKKILLATFRSYWSPSGNTVRTVVEGGPLLDVLAEVAEEKEDKLAQKNTNVALSKTATSVKRPKS